jgi:hypothetical protein
MVRRMVCPSHIGCDRLQLNWKYLHVALALDQASQPQCTGYLTSRLRDNVRGRHCLFNLGLRRILCTGLLSPRYVPLLRRPLCIHTFFMDPRMIEALAALHSARTADVHSGTNSQTSNRVPLRSCDALPTPDWTISCILSFVVADATFICPRLAAPRVALRTTPPSLPHRAAECRHSCCTQLLSWVLSAQRTACAVVLKCNVPLTHRLVHSCWWPLLVKVVSSRTVRPNLSAGLKLSHVH